MPRRVVREEIDDGDTVVDRRGIGWNPIPAIVAVIAVVILVLVLWSPISNLVSSGNDKGGVHVTYDKNSNSGGSGNSNNR